MENTFQGIGHGWAARIHPSVIPPIGRPSCRRSSARAPISACWRCFWARSYRRWTAALPPLASLTFGAPFMPALMRVPLLRPPSPSVRCWVAIRFGLAWGGLRPSPSADDLGLHIRDLELAAAILAGPALHLGVPDDKRSCFRHLHLAPTISFIVQNLPLRLVVYGIAAYSMNLELSLNIAASIEGWFSDNWSWKWILWDMALLMPLMLICIHFGMPRQPVNRELLKNADWAGILYASLRVQPPLCGARPRKPPRLAEFWTYKCPSAGRGSSGRCSPFCKSYSTIGREISISALRPVEIFPC